MKKTSFNIEEIRAFTPSEKIGLVASINPDGMVHITLITSIMASTPTQLTLGQFCSGRGKWYIQENNKVSFLIMTLDQKMWRGRAMWTHKKKEGPEYELYNEMPMFRYNTYFGINTVHYLDLVETTEKESLPLQRIIPATLATKIAKSGVRSNNKMQILKPFAENLFNQLDALKFISYLDNDGYPVIIPIIQCQAADSTRLTFSTMAYNKELAAIKKDTLVTVFCLNLKMQSVLIRGKMTGYRRLRLFNMGIIDINWVYNSMPPIHDQIYPEVKLKPVINF